MARDPDDSGRLVTVHLCTVNGVAMKFYRVTTEMPPESITIEVPMVQEIILGDE